MKRFAPAPDTAPWWARLCAGELTVQVCPACSSVQPYPRSGCVRCMNEALELRAASGRGHVYSFTVVWRAPNAEFAADVPYVLALVELDEGPRLLTRLLDTVPAAARVGMEVCLVGCEPVSDAASLPLFTPVRRGE